MSNKVFARLKWWEIYLYGIVGVGFFNFLYVVIIGGYASNETAVDSLFVINIFISVNLVVLYWQWSVAHFFVELRDGLRRVPLFRVSVIFNSIISLVLAFLMNSGYLYDSADVAVEFPSFIEELSFMLYVYSSFWLAKNIVALEEKCHVKFFDFAGTGVQVMFLPITLLFVQPRINKIYLELIRGIKGSTH